MPKKKGRKSNFGRKSAKAQRYSNWLHSQDADEILIQPEVAGKAFSFDIAEEDELEEVTPKPEDEGVIQVVLQQEEVTQEVTTCTQEMKILIETTPVSAVEQNKVEVWCSKTVVNHSRTMVLSTGSQTLLSIYY